MIQRVLIFYPGNPSYIGLWQPSLPDLWQTQTVTSGRTSDANAVFESLHALLKKNSSTIKEVTAIGVMQGPASYTQLRSFIASANSMAWALRLPLFGFSADSVLPDNLPTLVATAHKNMPIEPVYPTQIGYKW
jgi:hypothetical protein